MEVTEEQYQEIKGLPPKRRRHVRIDNRTPFNALIYRCEHGCKRRSLPQRFGNRRVIWIEAAGGTRRVGTGVQGNGRGKTTRIGRGMRARSTTVKVHPDVRGEEKNGGRGIGKSRGGRGRYAR
ncbi:MAG: hypothetical protein LBB48_08700 [Treponema sp.]|nr:hypothetical protein [Treponema sp.]